MQAALKLLALGFHGYTRSGWNVFDFTVVLIGVADKFMPTIVPNLTAARMVRLLRVARLLRMLSLKSLATQLRSLLRAVPATRNVLTACLGTRGAMSSGIHAKQTQGGDRVVSVFVDVRFP